VQPPIDEKYIVFKRSEWEAHKSQTGCMPETMAVTDAVVIRTQDVFAGPALHTYANMIQIALALASPRPTTDLRDLRRIADYFHTRAVEADERAAHSPRIPTLHSI
jgi:hypothetical protein